MIATWMFAATLLGLLAGGAALAVERVLRLLNREGRHVWLFAVVATCVWPLLAPALPRAQVRATLEQVTTSEVRALAAGTVEATIGAPGLRDRLAALDQPIFVLWGIVTAVLLTRALVAVFALRGIARRAESRTVDGRPVLITPGIGPAAFGIVRPRIVLPRWSLELDTPLRALVVRHEVEHVRCADPAVLTIGWLIAALLPWNPALWWIVRRLRTATELDCDQRVIRGGADTRRYAQLLLLIAQRQGHAVFASMIAGSPSTLPIRIAAMHATPPARRILRATLLSLVALTLGALAASPALGRELASVRDRVAPLFVADAGAAGVPASQPADAPRVLPVVTTVASRTGGEPGFVAQDTAKKQKLSFKTVADDSTKKTKPDTTKKRKMGNYAVVRDTSFDGGKTRMLTLRDTSKRAQRDTNKGSRDGPVVLAEGSLAPRYPSILKTAGVSGVTIVQFVVDTTGRPIPETLKVVRSSHELFTNSVRTWLPELRFHAARVSGRHVKQLAQMVYTFEVQGYPPRDTVPEPTGPIPTFKVVITAVAPQ